MFLVGQILLRFLRTFIGCLFLSVLTSKYVFLSTNAYMGLLHLIFHSTAFLLLLYLDDPIFGQLLGLTSLFRTFQSTPLACAVSGFLVHVAGTLCPHTFVYHLYLYLASVLFLNHISFLTHFLFCSLAHSAAPMRLSLNWPVLNLKHSNNNVGGRRELLLRSLGRLS